MTRNSHSNAEFRLHDFQSSRATVLFTLHAYLGQDSVAAVFTLHDGSATEGFTLHDFTIGRIADNSVWHANYVSQPKTREM